MIDVPLPVVLGCIEDVVLLLKQRFPNLTTEETIKFANQILRVVVARMEQP